MDKTITNKTDSIRYLGVNKQRRYFVINNLNLFTFFIRGFPTMHKFEIYLQLAVPPGVVAQSISPHLFIFWTFKNSIFRKLKTLKKKNSLLRVSQNNNCLFVFTSIFGTGQKPISTTLHESLFSNKPSTRLGKIYSILTAVVAIQAQRDKIIYVYTLERGTPTYYAK